MGRRISLFCPLIISLCLVIVLYVILEKRDTKAYADQSPTLTSLRVLSNIVRSVNIGAISGPIRQRKFGCPRRRPILVKETDNHSQIFECGPPIPCTTKCYKSSECVTPVRTASRKDFVSKFSCLEMDTGLISCNYTCCYSNMYDLTDCGKVTTVRNQPVTHSERYQGVSTSTTSNWPAVVGRGTSFEVCFIKHKKGNSVCNEKHHVPGTIVNYQCNSSRPILVNGKMESNDRLYCGRNPCNSTCYADFSCTNERSDYYVSTFQCLIADGDVEPYRCVFSCCRSNATRLENCTWHLPTYMRVDKGPKFSTVVRRTRFFPYMIEVCGMKKLNGCEAIGLAQGGPALQPEIAPVGMVALANLGQLGRLSVINEMTQLTRRSCDPIDLLVLLDNTGSLHTSGFANEQTFVNGIFNYFNFGSTVGTNRSRVALMDFGDTTELLWDFDRYENDPSADAHLTKALMSVPYKGSATTNTFSPNAPDGESSFQGRQQRFSNDLLSLEAVSGEQMYTSTTSTDLLINYPGLVLDRTTFAWSTSELSQLAKAQVLQICSETKATSTATSTTPLTTTSISSSATTSSTPSTTFSTTVSTTTSSSTSSSSISTTSSSTSTSISPSTTTSATSTSTSPSTTTSATFTFTSSSTTTPTTSTFTSSSTTTPTTSTFTSSSTTTPTTSMSTTTSTPSLSTSTTSAATTATKTSSSTSTTTVTATSTTFICAPFQQPCTADGDCCSGGSATMRLHVHCLSNTCDCIWPFYFGGNSTNICCDGQPNLPTYDAIAGYQCPTGIHYSACLNYNGGGVSNVSCGAGLFCSDNPESDNVFGQGGDVGICLFPSDQFYGQ